MSERGKTESPHRADLAVALDDGEGCELHHEEYANGQEDCLHGFHHHVEAQHDLGEYRGILAP